MPLQGIGVSQLEPDTIPSHSVKVILTDSFNIVSSHMRWERAGGCGTHGPDGGSLERPDIRNIMQVDLEIGKLRRETGWELACIWVIPICCLLI